MRTPMLLCRTVRRNKHVMRRVVFGAALVAILAIGWGYAADDFSNDVHSIFARFRDDDGLLQSAPAFSGLNGSNTFFQTSFGTNGQTCATCHEPSDGFTIHVDSIQKAFEESDGKDPLFRPNDTANNPNDPKAAGDDHEDLEEAYSLELALGVTRISEIIPANAEFIVAPQETEEFGPLPIKGNDPQHPGATTLSLFRRPLVPTNMRFDSAVLWDGRANITNIRAQVTGAAKTLLLAPAPTNAQLDDVANFMLGVFTDEVVDDRSSDPPSFAGPTNEDGATSGVDNLVSLASSSSPPCLFDPSGKPTQSLTPAVTYFPSQGPNVLTPSTCTTVIPGGPNMTTFAAWANQDKDSTKDASQRRIAHGEDIFNTAVLHINVNDENDELRRANQALAAQLGTTEIHCTTCHATNNLGNHPEASFLVRIGSDSVPILKALEHRNHKLDDFVKRTKMLPQYCLRNTSGPSLASVECGDYEGDESKNIPGDVITSDPGRAMITGKWADIGKFKPPILRNLAVRSPYFHGSAADSTVSIIEFYDTRFNIGLSQHEKDDLVRFVEAH